MLIERLVMELRRAPAHGYPLKGALERRGVRVVAGTVYGVLRRLERDGVLSGRWEDGRRRRVYRLTRLGEELLCLRRLELRSAIRR